jgi:hypothetical protein
MCRHLINLNFKNAIFSYGLVMFTDVSNGPLRQKSVFSILTAVRTSYLVKLTSSLQNQPNAGSEMKPQTYDRECDNVLHDQGYRTAQGVVTDEYRTMVEC